MNGIHGPQQNLENLSFLSHSVSSHSENTRYLSFFLKKCLWKTSPLALGRGPILNLPLPFLIMKTKKTSRKEKTLPQRTGEGEKATEAVKTITLPY